MNHTDLPRPFLPRSEFSGADRLFFGSNMPYEWPIVFAVHDPKATGQDVAMLFASTFQWPRAVEWLPSPAGAFRFVDGTHTYFLECTKTGWVVKIREAT